MQMFRLFFGLLSTNVLSFVPSGEIRTILNSFDVINDWVEAIEVLVNAIFLAYLQYKFWRLSGKLREFGQSGKFAAISGRSLPCY